MTVVAHRDLDEATVNRDAGVFGDIVANAFRAVDEEVARRYRLGLPVIVSNERGEIVDLNRAAAR
jgi:hypothetical protein